MYLVVGTVDVKVGRIKSCIITYFLTTTKLKVYDAKKVGKDFGSFHLIVLIIQF